MSANNASLSGACTAAMAGMSNRNAWPFESSSAARSIAARASARSVGSHVVPAGEFGTRTVVDPRPLTASREDARQNGDHPARAAVRDSFRRRDHPQSSSSPLAAFAAAIARGCFRYRVPAVRARRVGYEIARDAARRSAGADSQQKSQCALVRPAIISPSPTQLTTHTADRMPKTPARYAGT